MRINNTFSAQKPPIEISSLWPYLGGSWKQSSGNFLFPMNFYKDTKMYISPTDILVEYMKCMNPKCV